MSKVTEEELKIIRKICNFNLDKDIDFTIKKDFLRIKILIDKSREKKTRTNLK